MISIVKELAANEKFDFRDSIFDSVLDIFEKDLNIIVLTNDMGALGLDKMREIDATRVINVGITEQNMVSVASGLALSGKYVFVYGIISHVIFRAFEQIKLDICVQNLPVCIIGVGAGLAYGVDGPTHHGTEDIGALSALPNIQIFNPSDDCSARETIKFAYSLKTPCFVRMDKEQLPQLYPDGVDLTVGYEVHGHANEIVLICSGMTTWTGLKAREVLKEKYNVNITVIDILRPKYFLGSKMVNLVSGCKKVYVIDEASEFGGFSSLIARTICGASKFSFTVLSLPDKYVTGSAKRSWAWQEYGLDCESLVATIIEGTTKQ